MKKEIHHKRTLTRGIALVLLVLFCLTAGCGKQEERLRDLDFTVISKECIPQELAEVLEEKKNEPFGETYTDGEFLYLCAGYGQTDTGGYSIIVKDIYLTDTSIYLDTTLVGPTKEEKEKNNTPAYPMIVIKIEYIDAPVIFL